jgi:hypothetical protein
MPKNVWQPDGTDFIELIQGLLHALFIYCLQLYIMHLATIQCLLTNSHPSQC